MSMIYASDLVVQGTGLELDGVPWSGAPTKCACCGKPILPGDIAVRDKHRFKQSFMDGPSLAVRGSGAVCGACSALMNAKPLIGMQCNVITKEGAFSIRKDVNRSWFLLTPPEPPWVAVVSDVKQCHMIWRTPVTVDNNLMIVRFGARIFRIRRQRLLQAIDDCAVAVQALEARQVRELGAKKKSAGDVNGALRHPFVALHRDMDDPAVGQVRNDVLSLLRDDSCDSKVRSAITALYDLTPGEIWALATLVKRKVEDPQRPDPIHFIGL